jgi:hypothetical protein
MIINIFCQLLSYDLRGQVNFSSITARDFPTLYLGSEAVVAGKLADSFEDEQEDPDFGTISARGVDGNAIKENITLPESEIKSKKNVTVSNNI